MCLKLSFTLEHLVTDNTLVFMLLGLRLARKVALVFVNCTRFGPVGHCQLVELFQPGLSSSPRSCCICCRCITEDFLSLCLGLLIFLIPRISFPHECDQGPHGIVVFSNSVVSNLFVLFFHQPAYPSIGSIREPVFVFPGVALLCGKSIPSSIEWSDYLLIIVVFVSKVRIVQRFLILPLTSNIFLFCQLLKKVPETAV